MKKILQRIGLLAAAVMLLWGWQGMDAKAADEENYSFGFSCTGDQKDKIDVSKLNIFKDSDMYYIDVYPVEGYLFEVEPTVNIRPENFDDDAISLTNPEKKEGYYYRYCIDKSNLPSSSNKSYVIIVFNQHPLAKEIKEVSITVSEPVAGQPFPTEWKINTEGVTGTLRWSVPTTDEEVTGIAEPNTEYSGTIALIPESGYAFKKPVNVYPDNYFQVIDYTSNEIIGWYLFTTGDAQPSNPGNTNTEITWEKWNDWTINRDKLENGRIAKGYGLSGSAAESHDAHLFLYVEPKDGYYFTEEPKVSWNDTLLVPLPKDSSTLYGYKYQLDDNGSGTIVVEGKAVKKDTAEPQANEPQANTSQSSNDTYKIINGARSTWNGSTTEGLTIRGDGDFAKFAGVRVDGNWIPSAHYEAKSGSTIVTLKPSYLASLSEGEHTVDIMWIDDSASTTFTVAANTAAAQPELDSVPKTGEGVMGWMPEILLLVAAGLTIMGALRLKKAK